MPHDKKKKLHDFLSGKESPEGKNIFDAWYHAFDDRDHPGNEVTDDGTLKNELRQIKAGRPVRALPERRRYTRYWKAAAAITIFLSAGLFLYIRHNTRVHEELVWQERHIARGQRQHLALSDGTQVWLNAETTFRFPEAFDARKREVYLQGEAFFEVEKDAQKPFVIHSGNLTTTVVGTSFNIKAYGTDPEQEVAVITGKVAVTLDQGNEHAHNVLLLPGQKALHTTGSDTLLTARFENAARYTSWRDGKLSCEDTPVNDVLNAVGRLYNVQIASDTVLATCRVTATFDAMPLKDMLDLLCLTLNATYAHPDHRYTLTGPGCN